MASGPAGSLPGSAELRAAHSAPCVVIARGEGWWADLDEPTGSEPVFRRPVLLTPGRCVQPEPNPDDGRGGPDFERPLPIQLDRLKLVPLTLKEVVEARGVGLSSSRGARALDGGLAGTSPCL